MKILYWSPSKYYYKLILITALLSCGSGVSGKNINKTGGISGIANPASVNCINQGGRLSIQKREDGGEYGICIFEDNGQCEEWALYRGECPAGGRKVTGDIPDEKPPLEPGNSI